MEAMMEYQNYKSYKNALDKEMLNAAESFVKIGHLLSIAKETDILKESGYENVYDFAEAEYNLDRSQVSRFINIYKRFGETGTDRLKEQYRGYGVAKLGLMLMLPDEINEELTQEYSKREIQAIKDEVDAEKQITDIEVMLEKKEEWQQAMDNNLSMAVHQLGHTEPELYKSLHEALKTVRYQEPARKMTAVYEVLAPAGESIYSVRVQGVGRLMLSIKGLEQEISLTNIRSNEKEHYSWEEMLEALDAILNFEDKTADVWKAVEAKESWEAVYGEPFPKKEEVAPVQPQQKKAEPRKQSKVTKAKPKEQKEKAAEKKEEVAPVQPEQINLNEVEKSIPVPDPKENDENEEKVQQAGQEEARNTEATEGQQGEEQLPGQREIEDYPEVLPENVENTVCEVESAEGEIQTEEELQEEALMIARKIVQILEDYEQLPENMAGACVQDAESLVFTVRELHKAVKERSRA